MTSEEKDATSTQPPDNGEGEGVPVDQIMLKGLLVLPPRQQEHPGEDASHLAHAIALPPLRADEPVQSLRAALSEVIGYAHLTNFRFMVVEKPAAALNGHGPAVNSEEPPLISPYTGKKAFVTVPLAVKFLDKNEEIPAVTIASVGALDEYGLLATLVDQGWHEKEAAFEIVLERYDAATVKEHIVRLRTLLAGSIPSVTSLVDEDGNVSLPPEHEEPEQPEPSSPQSKAESTDGTENKKDGKEPPSKKPLPPLPAFGQIEKLADGNPDLTDFFYHASGEDPALYRDSNTQEHKSKNGSKSTKKKRKAKGGPKGKSGTSPPSDDDEGDVGMSPEETLTRQIPRWNELDEQTKLPVSILYGGFHPPPSQRRLMGDLAYIEVTVGNPSNGDEESKPIHITATRTGFYVNKCSTQGGEPHFDPSPAAEPCFSHALLDCLLQASGSFRTLWKNALALAKERSELIRQFNGVPTLALLRIAARGDFAGFSSASSAAALLQQQFEGSLATPSWLAPRPKHYPGADAEDAWNGHQFHSYSAARVEEDICNSFGIELRTGGSRDWNEELQMAREMPTSTLQERIERARLLHKVMTEYGEAALLGVKAITEGQITPMNPNESARSQVFLHNNIFFSRAVDAGPETFKVARGDAAARKAANRDIQCISTFHRAETAGLYTLATVLIDYLGTRYVCQSILPGILINEKSHTFLYGSVETRLPLKWDKELHDLLEESIGESMMIATRPILRHPLTDERVAEIKKLSEAGPFYAELEKKLNAEKKEKVEPNAVIETCIPVEAKGIRGSDERKYLLDFGRITPRDANWVSEQKGGTGRLEAARKEAQSGPSKSTTAIPLTLDDDEWITCVLRPELVSRFVQHTFAKYMQDKKKKADAEKKNDEAAGKADAGTDEQKKTAKDDKSEDKKADERPGAPSEEDMKFYRSLKLNINVFLPYMKSFEGVNEEAAEQMKMDEERARQVAAFLWDEILPKITQAVRDGSVQQLSVDGKALTEFLHRNGVNCRYLGRLAVLAKEEEAKDKKTEADLGKGRLTVIERRTMPRGWLELLECEMVARAAKHILDAYLAEQGGVAAMQPAQTIASFLSALVSENDETAAQTEARTEKRSAKAPDDEEFSALTMCDTGGDGDAVAFLIRSRYEVWQDIELEVGRRFRYSLSLYNNGNKSGRTLYIPLLRRFCQRAGVRLVAKNYEVGGNCYCGNMQGGRLVESYPVSPLDVVDILPLMKHAAAYNEGFLPCSVSPSVSIPPLQVSLRDARNALERAHIQAGSRALGRSLELAQEAAALYQGVTENPAHPGVIDTIELMSTIFLDAGDAEMAAANGSKALALSVQCGGFDTASTFSGHMTLFQMYHTLRRSDLAVKHLRAGIYILQVMAGPHHTENFTGFHKLGTVYSNEEYSGEYLSTAKELFQEATKRDSCDRLMDGITSKSLARVLASLGQYSEAVDAEKKACKTFSLFLGREHQLALTSDADLKSYTKLAVEKGNRRVETESLREQAAKADAVAAALAAEEDKAKAKKNKKKKGKK